MREGQRLLVLTARVEGERHGGRLERRAHPKWWGRDERE